MYIVYIYESFTQSSKDLQSGVHSLLAQASHLGTQNAMFALLNILQSSTCIIFQPAFSTHLPNPQEQPFGIARHGPTSPRL